MAREQPAITISADALEIEGSDEWPVLISLKKAYREACAAPGAFLPDTPWSALLGALQSGAVRAKSPRFDRITRWNTSGTAVERQFTKEYILPEQWAKCVAFNPIEDSMNLESGEPHLHVAVYAMDFCDWLKRHKDPYGKPTYEFSDEALALSEVKERRRFEDVYLFSKRRMKLTKRGAPTGHEWAKAVAHVILARLHQRNDGERNYRQADWARCLQDALGDADGGPADSTANEYAALIMKELEHWRSRGADFG